MVIFNVLLQTRAVLEYSLAGATAGQQRAGILAIVLAAFHVTAEQVALVESLMTLLAVMHDTVLHAAQGFGSDKVLTVLVGFVNFRNVRRQVFPRRASLRTVRTGDVRVALVYPVHVFPQM